jgi:DNA-binding MarR family transcriptional regulator
VKSPPDAPRKPAERPPLDTAELDAAVGFWLRLAQQRDLRAFGERFSGSGVSQLGYAILLVLEANPGRRPAELGEAVQVRQPNLGEPLEALVALGLVSRTPDPRDGRAQVLALTPDGRRRLQQLKAAHAGLIEGYREALGEEGYDQLIALLRRFTPRHPG